MKHAHSALGVLPQVVTGPPRLIRPTAVSGQHRRAALREVPKVEEFEEPDLELLALSEKLESRTPIELELAQAQLALGERERQVSDLDRQVDELRQEVARLIGDLSRKQAEFDELSELLLPAIATPSIAPSKAPSAPDAGDTNALPFGTETIPSLSVAVQPLPSLTHDAVPSPPPAFFGNYPTLSNLSVSRSESVPPAECTDIEARPSQRPRAPRQECKLDIEFSEDSEFYAGITQDISRGGVFIATYRIFPVGTRLQVGFQLPCGTTVEARGEVRWIRDPSSAGARPGMGIAFSAVSSEAHLAIESFCRVRSPLYVEI